MLGELVITAQGLTRYFGHKTVVHDMELRIPRGSVTGLLGLNGAARERFELVLNRPLACDQFGLHWSDSGYAEPLRGTLMLTDWLTLHTHVLRA